MPGLAGVEIGTASGMRIGLDRGPGGWRPIARTAGARVELDRAGRITRRVGDPGGGIRQALLRDPAYARALGCAEAMLR